MKKQRAERLRTTVDFLPPDTKRAMLEGLERNRIITGANTDRRGGMCPMIAADRNAFQSGPMADIFAAVWDSYNGACILNRRDASERDLRVLKTMLETSLANSPELSSELGQAWLDYHVGSEAAPPAADRDFEHELTTALEQSAMHDTGSFAAVPGSPAELTAAARQARQISLIYDGGPLPARAPAPDPAAVSPKPAAAELNSTYEPYRVAAPKPRTPLTRSLVDQPGKSRAALHAARTTDSAERARARAVIANQAATLRNRAWPRSADAATATDTGRVAADAARMPQSAPAPVPAPTALEAPAIRQAAIPQRRSLQTPATADRSTAELDARSGWSWLPPMRSYDDHDGATADAGTDAGRQRPVPEAQPPEGERRSVRM